MNNKNIINTTPFIVFHVPLILFEGIASEYGEGTERETRGYKVISLCEDDVGFSDVIGFNKHSSGTIFVLWPSR